MTESSASTSAALVAALNEEEDTCSTLEISPFYVGNDTCLWKDVITVGEFVIPSSVFRVVKRANGGLDG